MLMSKPFIRQSLEELASTMSVPGKVILLLMQGQCACCISVSSEPVCVISGITVKEFVEACKKATGADIKVEYLSRRPGDYAEVYSDPSKINRELNWTAHYTDLEKSLSIAWRWQKSHRNGYGSP